MQTLFHLALPITMLWLCWRLDRLEARVEAIERTLGERAGIHQNYGL
jgi:hypothetical protein